MRVKYGLLKFLATRCTIGAQMYAVIRTGGKQYRVSEGDKIRVEKLTGEVGDKVEISEVLMVSGEKMVVGKPLVPGAKVSAEIVAQDRAKKIIVFKLKEKKNYRRKAGHRQPYTELKVTGIAV
jgi:large subunit ribosomal protein L21